MRSRTVAAATRGGLEEMPFPWGEGANETKLNGWQGAFPKENTGADGFKGVAPVRAYEPNGSAPSHQQYRQYLQYRSYPASLTAPLTRRSELSSFRAFVHSADAAGAVRWRLQLYEGETSHRLLIKGTGCTTWWGTCGNGSAAVPPRSASCAAAASSTRWYGRPLSLRHSCLSAVTTAMQCDAARLAWPGRCIRRRPTDWAFGAQDGRTNHALRVSTRMENSADSVLPVRMIALPCTALHCTTLHCPALHCPALPCTALHCTALHCTALHCTAHRTPSHLRAAACELSCARFGRCTASACAHTRECGAGVVQHRLSLCTVVEA